MDMLEVDSGAALNYARRVGIAQQKIVRSSDNLIRSAK